MPTPLAVYAEQKRQKREAERAAKLAAIAAATPAPVEPPAPVVVPPSELQVIRITEMLAAAQAELADAEEEHREASFVATTEPGQPAYQRLAAARRGLDEAKGKVNAVVAAMEVARQRAADALQQSVTLSHAQRVAAVQALLVDRDDAVARLADALAEAVAAYDELLKINGQVIETYPVGRAPLSAFLGRGEAGSCHCQRAVSAVGRASPERHVSASSRVGMPGPSARRQSQSAPRDGRHLSQAGAFLVRELATPAGSSPHRPAGSCAGASTGSSGRDHSGRADANAWEVMAEIPKGFDLIPGRSRGQANSRRCRALKNPRRPRWSPRNISQKEAMHGSEETPRPRSPPSVRSRPVTTAGRHAFISLAALIRPTQRSNPMQYPQHRPYPSLPPRPGSELRRR